MNTSSRGLKISTQTIVLAVGDMELFTRPSCQQVELLLSRNFTQHKMEKCLILKPLKARFRL